MRRLLLIAVLVAFAAPLAVAAVDGDSSPTIAQLIADLGHDEYAVRRRAEEQLLSAGPEAFDQLTAAAGSKDLEVAERAQYIIQRLQMHWVRRDDPLEVRRVLARFGSESEESRIDRVGELGKLEDGSGGAALCRIARFDPSPLVSRRAAMAILELELSADKRRALATVWKAELGTSDRPPVLWIELYLRELDESEHAIAEWAEANAAELAVYKKEKGVTDFATLRDLILRHLDRCHELDLAPATTAALLMLIDMNHDLNEPGQLDVGLAWSLDWIIRRQRWDSLEPLEDKYEFQFKKNRKLLYLLAVATSKAKKSERAEEIAERAFKLPDVESEQRIEIVERVAALGRVDWAEREYRRLIETRPVLDKTSMEARSDLAIWLHDREEYQAAADLLAEFCDALAADAPARRQLVDEINDDPRLVGGKETIAGIEARRYFYLACVDEQRQDYEAQRSHLKQANGKYGRDPDILIALYRLPGGTDDQRQAVKASIRKVASDFMQDIRDYPALAMVYNQWAWLIANTEGDQQKAVEYSLKSLELAPDEPSYLDTLGRCYYSVGDYENAVKAQRKAVELAPHYRVMQRQLAVFERALAEGQPPDASRNIPELKAGDESDSDSASPAKIPPDSDPHPFGIGRG